MIQKSMQIQLANGLEARPVAVLVQKASMFDSQIYIEAEGKKVNAKKCRLLWKYNKIYWLDNVC